MLLLLLLFWIPLAARSVCCCCCWRLSNRRLVRLTGSKASKLANRLAVGASLCLPRRMRPRPAAPGAPSGTWFAPKQRQLAVAMSAITMGRQFRAQFGNWLTNAIYISSWPSDPGCTLAVVTMQLELEVSSSSRSDYQQQPQHDSKTLSATRLLFARRCWPPG